MTAEDISINTSISISRAHNHQHKTHKHEHSDLNTQSHAQHPYHQCLTVSQNQLHNRSRSPSPNRACNQGGHSKDRGKNSSSNSEISPEALSQKLCELVHTQEQQSLTTAKAKEEEQKKNNFLERPPLVPPDLQQRSGEMVQDILGRLEENQMSVATAEIVRTQHTHKINPDLLSEATHSLKQRHGHANLHHS